MSLSFCCSSRRDESSCSILIASSRASCRRRISRISSACRSESPKARDQRGLGLVSLPDDADHLVDVQQDQLPPLEDVDAVVDPGEPERRATAHGDDRKSTHSSQDVEQRLLPRRPSRPIMTSD
jgi:hypothetical protein